MKKTLFAMAALALCGTAFAETYNTSTLTPDDLASFQKTGEAITLNVDKTVTFGDIKIENASSATLNFVGSNTFSATDTFTMTGSVLSITGDATAATYWESQLLQSAGEAIAIKLVSVTGSDKFLGLANPTFMGTEKNQTLTLGNTELTYKGIKNGTGLMFAKLTTADDEIALVSVSTGADKGLYLVGKATAPATPEPATATLSLLALAGLASRRRRK